MSPYTLQHLKRKLSQFDYKKYLKANRANILLWITMFVTVYMVIHFLSDGDFSFLLTLASLTSAFGFILVLVRCVVSHSVNGISLKSMECYAVVYILRLITISNTLAYLPSDKTGDWLYNTINWICLIVILLIIYMATVPLKYDRDSHRDTLGNELVGKNLGALLIIVPCIILALIVRPQRAAKGLLDFCWAASMYIESVSILPQLHMFKKSRTGEVESFTSHYVFAMFLSKLFDFFFWMGSWKELNGYYGFISTHFAGITIILDQILQLGLMSSFIFYYVRSAILDSPMMLPTFQSMRSD